MVLVALVENEASCTCDSSLAQVSSFAGAQIKVSQKVIARCSGGDGRFHYSQIFLSWHLGAERQTCHVTLIVPHDMN